MSDSLARDLVTWRRHLHSHPELSFHEFETAAYIEQQLRDMGLSPRRVAQTGVYVDLPLQPGDAMVAVRADIDALPLAEATGLPYKSQNPGVMHACGHDGHTAIALGVVRRLLDVRASARDARGTVRVFFQPAEEAPPGGAQNMIRDGVLEGVKAVVGLHLWSFLPVGVAGISYGALTANADVFEVDVAGRGGHGALPHKSVDALLVACELVQRFQTIVSRQMDPLEPAVVTVGSLHAGSSHNIIADTARLTGTVRTTSDGARRFIRDQIERSSQAICEMYGARADFSWTDGYPAVVNHEPVARVLEQVCREELGGEMVEHVRPTMVGEDFAYYLKDRPGAFLVLGVADADLQSDYPHHHPRFTIAERMLEPGVDILTETALRLLAANLAD